MNAASSLYLDLVRFGAAALVFLHHWVYPRLSGTTYESLGGFGEDAVMIFFVLSGYVISYVTTEQHNTVREYGVNRFARLYSVVIPALLLTVAFDTLGRHLSPMLYDGWWYQSSEPWLRTLTSLGFLNNLWTLNVRFFSNGPYWSISYEFWYYVMFGIALFAQGHRRWILLALCALLVGPQILMLFPIWLLGVWVYRFNATHTLSAAAGWTLALSSVAAYFIYRYIDLGAHLMAMSDAWIAPFMNPRHLHKARVFLHDYIIGILVAAHFIGMHAVACSGQLKLSTLATPIRYVASFTFTLYLLHYPLLHLLTAASPWPVGDARHQVFLVIGTLIVVWAVGSVTERKKHVWRKLIAYFWDLAAQRMGKRLGGIPAVGERGA
jgi:peptidoglycan/LPS O-acetylase OafA/YrhL